MPGHAELSAGGHDRLADGVLEAEQGGHDAGPLRRCHPPQARHAGVRLRARSRAARRYLRRTARDLSCDAMLSRAHSWLDRHPTAADAALAVVALVFSLSTMTGERNEPTAGALIATVLLICPLALRRRAPVAVFAAVMVACLRGAGADRPVPGRERRRADRALHARGLRAPQARRDRLRRRAGRHRRGGRARRRLHLRQRAADLARARAARRPGRDARRPPPRPARRARAAGRARRRRRAGADRARAARRRRPLALGRDRPGRRRPLRRGGRPRPRPMR